MSKTARAILSRLSTPLWPVTAVGIALGAAFGGAVLHTTGDQEVEALVRVYEPIDPSQIMLGSGSGPDDKQSFISGEITYLNSAGFADAVAKRLNVTEPPEVSAVQDAQSRVIVLSYTAPEVAEAKRTIDAEIQVYGDHVAQQTREREQAAIDAINRVMAQLTPAPIIGENGESLSAPAPSADAQAQIQQLELQRQAIEVQSQRPAGVQVIQPPTVTPDSGAPSWALGAVAGGLGGGLLSLLGGLAWRRRAGIVTDASTIDGLVDNVIVPVVRLGPTQSHQAHMRLARVLYAQLPKPRAGNILLVGATAASGTGAVAALIGDAAAEHGSVSRITLDDNASALESADFGYQGSSSDSADPGATIIDGGTLSTSPALHEAAEGASQIILVVRLGHDAVDHVHTAVQLARHSGTSISTVFTRPAPVLLRRSASRRGDAAKALESDLSPIG